MKKNILRIILLILLGLTFYIIFGFSGQDGESSGTISQRVTQVIININPCTKNLDIQKKYQIEETLHPIVRKIAHFSIYTLVGILLMSFMSTYNINKWKRIVTSLMVGFMYACTDEFHQSFIPGRSNEFKDVLIDTSGVITGIIIVYIILYIYNKICIKIEK